MCPPAADEANGHTNGHVNGNGATNGTNGNHDGYRYNLASSNFTWPSLT
jgi:hypothetical protein